MKNVTLQLAKVMALLMVLVSMTMVTQPLGVAAQAAGQTTSSQTAGSAIVEFTDVWQYDMAASDPESVFLTSLDLPGTAFIYAEIADPITSVDGALAQFTGGFFSEFGDGDHLPVDGGAIPTDTAWQLYTVSLDGLPYGVYVSANVGEIPGVVKVTVLMSAADTFDLATRSAQQDITINGAGTSLSTFDSRELAAALLGASATPGSTPAAGATPAAGTDRGNLTLPPLDNATPATPPQTTQPPTQAAIQLTESVTVNLARIAYGGDWTYSEQTSTPDQIAFFINDVNPSTIFGYATIADTSGDVVLALSEFYDGFFGSFSATNVVEVSSELLPSGLAYALFTADRADGSYVILAYADVTSSPGQFRAQVLIAPLDDFDAAFASVQRSFQVDGVGAMSELDGAQFSGLLGTGGGAQPSTATTTTTASTAQGAAGSITEFQSVDAQGSCDAIGWVVTSPDQLPASEADVDYRSTCVGGAAFFAYCGTMAGTDLGAPEPGMIWVRCEFTVAVNSAPMELFVLDYSLVDGAGAVYPVDFLALIATTDFATFPEGQVAVGETAQGSVAFSVPQDAPGPWVIQVNPTALITTGEAPSTLVIDGELQPYEAFGQ